MTENSGTTTLVEKPKTETELLAAMDAASKTKDFKTVAKVAAELVKFQRDKEAAEQEAKQKALAAVTEGVKTMFSAVGQLLTSGHKPTAKDLEAVTKLFASIKGTELDQADGIWFSNDFGDKLVSCKLMKSQAKARATGGGGGVGKKFNVTTNELLEKFGNEVYKDGMTYKAAYDSSTDKNFRFGIRESLLKKGGYHE